MSWIVPFKGRNYSGATDQNFLWNDGVVYIMDNHRAALWCWFQHIKDQNEFNVFHVDQHYDTLYSNIKKCLEVCPELDGLNIEDYLNFSYGSGDKKTSYLNGIIIYQFFLRSIRKR